MLAADPAGTGDRGEGGGHGAAAAARPEGATGRGDGQDAAPTEVLTGAAAAESRCER